MLCSSTAIVLGSRSARRDFTMVRSFEISLSYTGSVASIRPSARTSRAALDRGVAGTGFDATAVGARPTPRCAPLGPIVVALLGSADEGAGGVTTATCG